MVHVIPKTNLRKTFIKQFSSDITNHSYFPTTFHNPISFCWIKVPKILYMKLRKLQSSFMLTLTFNESIMNRFLGHWPVQTAWRWGHPHDCKRTDKVRTSAHTTQSQRQRKPWLLTRDTHVYNVACICHDRRTISSIQVQIFPKEIHSRMFSCLVLQEERDMVCLCDKRQQGRDTLALMLSVLVWGRPTTRSRLTVRLRVNTFSGHHTCCSCTRGFHKCHFRWIVFKLHETLMMQWQQWW